jgi:hypothetical protein
MRIKIQNIIESNLNDKERDAKVTFKHIRDEKVRDYHQQYVNLINNYVKIFE